jgi:hypothetical protein
MERNERIEVKGVVIRQILTRLSAELLHWISRPAKQGVRELY